MVEPAVLLHLPFARDGVAALPADRKPEKRAILVATLFAGLAVQN